MSYNRKTRVVKRRLSSLVRNLLYGLLLLVPLVGFSGDTTPKSNEKSARRFRLGPFFEYRRSEQGDTFWAVRPFYSKESNISQDSRATDVLWPLTTFHRDREYAWWRFLIAYGSDNDIHDKESAWKWALFPLWFQGRSRHAEDYWALFPIYGRAPHLLLMDDIHFVMFPLYLNYQVNQEERKYYLWPIISRTGSHSDKKKTGVFPFYGETLRRDGDEHRYAFWPFWTSALYGDQRNPGSSWMLFPLYGRVNRKKEQQRLVIPPFFSRTETDTAVRWRLPWPLIETLRSEKEDKTSVWPFYGCIDRDDERRWYAAWPLIEHFNLRSKGYCTERSRFFPFYVNEKIYRTSNNNSDNLAAQYIRIWPFYAYEACNGISRAHMLEFSPIRYSDGISRNWAPFWTFYARESEGATTQHDALWGIVRFKTTSQDKVKE